MHFDGKNQAESEFENSNVGGKGCSRIIWEDIRESRIFSIPSPWNFANAYILLYENTICKIKFQLGCKNTRWAAVYFSITAHTDSTSYNNKKTWNYTKWTVALCKNP